MEAGLKQIWTEILDVRPIGIKDNFFHMGGHSIKAVLLAAQMSRVFEKAIPVRLIFDSPTIEEQASFLRGHSHLSSPGTLVPIQRNGNRRPLFCIHPFFGLAHCYQELSSLLGTDQPFYGLQCYGLETDQQPLSTIPEMAAAYLQAIRTVQPHGPYQLAGWSMGSLIAYEIAQELTTAGETISLLTLLEGRVPKPNAQLPALLPRAEWEKLVDEQEQENLRYMANRVPGLPEDPLQAPDPSRQMARYLADFINVPVDFPREQINRLSRIIAINQLAVESYRPSPYSGDVSLFRVPRQAAEESSYGWADLVRGELKIFEVPGTHDGFMSAPSVIVIAGELQHLLHAENNIS
jgi:thioesterase domain-containing protein